MSARDIVSEFKAAREQKLSTESLEEIRAWCSKRAADKPWYGEFGDSPKMLMKCDFMAALIDEVLKARAAMESRDV